MVLFDKIRLLKAKSGKLKLKDWNHKYGNDEDFVQACVIGSGAQEIEFASERLKGDADFILKLVQINPEVLKFCNNKIYDRFVQDIVVYEELELDKLFFAAKCCAVNSKSFKYLSEDVAKKYLALVKNSEDIVGVYHGKKEIISIPKGELAFDRLLNIRYDIVKVRDLISNI